MDPEKNKVQLMSWTRSWPEQFELIHRFGFRWDAETSISSKEGKNTLGTWTLYLCSWSSAEARKHLHSLINAWISLFALYCVQLQDVIRATCILPSLRTETNVLKVLRVNTFNITAAVRPAFGHYQMKTRYWYLGRYSFGCISNKF